MVPHEAAIGNNLLSGHQIAHTFKSLLCEGLEFETAVFAILTRLWCRRFLLVFEDHERKREKSEQQIGRTQ